MRTITELSGKLKNKKVLLRLDLNVPISNGEIIDNFKLEKILTTLGFLKKEGALVTIISHIGRDGSQSLKPVYHYLRKFFEIAFIKDFLSVNAQAILSAKQAGDIIMLENLRAFKGEREDDLDFAKKIAKWGEIYVNEAFAVSHRQHASIAQLPKLLPSYFGPVFGQEVEGLNNFFQTSHPRVVILGGNKLETKLPFIRDFLPIADAILIGGALANDFFKYQGYEMGESLVSNTKMGIDDLLKNNKIFLPVDVVVENSEEVKIKKPQQVLSSDRIVDIGPETIASFQKQINQARAVLWNGPLGDYPQGFFDGTAELIKILMNTPAEVFAGGGDTEHCISLVGLEEKFDFISTGGGAMLEFITQKTLIGIQAIEQNSPK